MIRMVVQRVPPCNQGDQSVPIEISLSFIAVDFDFCEELGSSPIPDYNMHRLVVFVMGGAGID